MNQKEKIPRLIWVATYRKYGGGISVDTSYRIHATEARQTKCDKWHKYISLESLDEAIEKIEQDPTNAVAVSILKKLRERF